MHRAFYARMEAENAIVDYDAKMIFDRVVDGVPMRAIAAGLSVSRAMLYNYLNADPERRSRYQEARRLAATEYAEKALEVLEDANPHQQASVSRAKNIADHLRWLAQNSDREQFGSQQKGAEVHMSIGSVHLGSLRELGSVKREQIEDADFEVVPALESGDDAE
jgi:hypothetical protein